MDGVDPTATVVMGGSFVRSFAGFTGVGEIHALL
jgi:hypothetical protein